jgi:hypothetical protein
MLCAVGEVLGNSPHLQLHTTLTETVLCAVGDVLGNSPHLQLHTTVQYSTEYSKSNIFHIILTLHIVIMENSLIMPSKHKLTTNKPVVAQHNNLFNFTLTACFGQ